MYKYCIELMTILLLTSTVIVTNMKGFLIRSKTREKRREAKLIRRYLSKRDDDLVSNFEKTSRKDRWVFLKTVTAGDIALLISYSLFSIPQRANIISYANATFSPEDYRRLVTTMTIKNEDGEHLQEFAYKSASD